jgi:hypothetical protein
MMKRDELEKRLERMSKDVKALTKSETKSFVALEFPIASAVLNKWRRRAASQPDQLVQLSLI